MVADRAGAAAACRMMPSWNSNPSRNSRAQFPNPQFFGAAVDACADDIAAATRKYRDPDRRRRRAGASSNLARKGKRICRQAYAGARMPAVRRSRIGRTAGEARRRLIRSALPDGREIARPSSECSALPLYCSVAMPGAAEICWFRERHPAPHDCAVPVKERGSACFPEQKRQGRNAMRPGRARPSARSSSSRRPTPFRKACCGPWQANIPGSRSKECPRWRPLAEFSHPVALMLVDAAFLEQVEASARELMRGIPWPWGPY